MHNYLDSTPMVVKMRIMKNKTPFLAQAELTNTSCGMGMGLKFTVVAPNKWSCLINGLAS